MCGMTLMFDCSMHIHTSRGAKAQELERLQNTTHGPIHLQNIQNPYKRGCIGPFDFCSTEPGIMEGNSYYLVPFSHSFTSYQERWGALGLVWFPFILKRAVSHRAQVVWSQAVSYRLGEEAKQKLMGSQLWALPRFPGIPNSSISTFLKTLIFKVPCPH